MMEPRRWKHVETQAVHAGIDHYDFQPVIPPIFQTSTFAFESADHGAALFAGRGDGYIYSRVGNPTVTALEHAVATLEGGHDALACSSGMAAINTALVGLLKEGDHIVCSDALYGTTNTLIENILSQFGIEYTLVDTSQTDQVVRAVRPNTKLFFIETPTNPTLNVTDIQLVSEIAHAHGALLVVDNTFMSPILQQPLKLGADIVIHSMTKFINGHADVIAGIIVVRSAGMHKRLRVVRNNLGGILAPMEAFLVHRGLKTLPLRMQRHCANALQLARHLEAHPDVEWVRYPGLPSHPHYELSRAQCTSGGGVVSFELRGGLQAGKRMMNAVRLCALAVSLGGVETLIEHPASMTHAGMSEESRRRANITDGLVRIAAGIEHIDDIIADVDQAIDSATGLGLRIRTSRLGQFIGYDDFVHHTHGAGI